MHLLTYANIALGYFKKQASPKASASIDLYGRDISKITKAQPSYSAPLPKIDYTESRDIMAAQRDAILAKVRKTSKFNVVYAPLPQFLKAKQARMSWSIGKVYLGFESFFSVLSHPLWLFSHYFIQAIAGGHCQWWKLVDQWLKIWNRLQWLTRCQNSSVIMILGHSVNPSTRKTSRNIMMWSNIPLASLQRQINWPHLSEPKIHILYFMSF